MTGNLLYAGDDVEAVVTTVLPFGLLVESETGLKGLVRGAVAAVGASVRVRVVEYDPDQSRFSATLVG